MMISGKKNVDVSITLGTCHVIYTFFGCSSGKVLTVLSFCRICMVDFGATVPFCYPPPSVSSPEKATPE